MYTGMNKIDIKPAAIMISVCSLIGVAIQYFTGFYWLTASFLIIIAVLVNGLVIFNEDLEKDGFDYEEGITNTADAKAAQRKANYIQLLIIVLLVVAMAWSYVSK
jgi:hypothetical protein